MSALNESKSMYCITPLTNARERRKHHHSAICASKWHWSKSYSCFTHELICFPPSFYNWNCSELLIDLSAHYNADLGQDEIKGCRQLPHSPAKASWLEGRLLWVRFVLSDSTEMNEKKENLIWHTVLYINDNKYKRAVLWQT